MTPEWYDVDPSESHFTYLFNVLDELKFCR